MGGSDITPLVDLWIMLVRNGDCSTRFPFYHTLHLLQAGHTALRCAEAGYHTAVVDFLRSRGASPPGANLEAMSTLEKIRSSSSTPLSRTSSYDGSTPKAEPLFMSSRIASLRDRLKTSSAATSASARHAARWDAPKYQYSPRGPSREAEEWVLHAQAARETYSPRGTLARYRTPHQPHSWQCRLAVGLSVWDV